MKDTLDGFFKLLAEVYAAFGYEEDWRAFPLVDMREYNWMMIGDGGLGSRVAWSREPFTRAVVMLGSNFWDARVETAPVRGPAGGAKVFTYRHLKRWVFRRDDFTMVLGDPGQDTRTDLYVFDNSKECKDENLKAVYKQRWG